MSEGFPAEALRRALVGLQRQMRRQRAAHGVSAGRLLLLSRLRQEGAPMPATELARAEQVQPQSLTRALAELEERGLITRTQCDTDRRVWRVAITEAGVALLREDARAQVAWLARMVAARLSPTEQGLLGLAVALLERLGEGGAPPEG